MVKPTAALKAAAWIYDRIWPPVIPFLRRHRRLSHGFDQRLANPAPRRAGVWIQAASAGEAYLSLELAKAILERDSGSILLTAHTRQGLQILQNGVLDGTGPLKQESIQTAYFPLDRPRIMQRAVNAVEPGVMVLLETEIWPGHLLALKQIGCRILLVNGRLTARSLNRYRLWPDLWRQLSPDEILAVSSDDADRFKRLFVSSTIAAMPNMKFDRMAQATAAAPIAPVADLFPATSPFIVLGSVRRQEERQIAAMMAALLDRLPGLVIGLFPRHMERLAYWQMTLARAGLPWQYRSRLNHPAKAGSIILWDRFGELAGAYGAAEAAFVGGSLMPLGGQNFLEPLQAGILPVIGPHWDNFRWVGPEIVAEGLLQVAADWQSAVGLLARTVAGERSRADIRAAAQRYISARRGGTRQACDLILKHLRAGRR